MQSYASVPDPTLSLAHGPPIADEPDIGALTLGGWLREVTERHAAREAIVQQRPDGTSERWTYADLWDRAMQVARSLIACGTGKGERIGLLTTNRSEFVAGCMGASLAGAVAVPLSTFSTAPELDHLLRASACSILIAEPEVLGRDMIALVAGLETDGADSSASPRFPFLRHLVALDLDGPRLGFEPWSAFLARGTAIDPAHVHARASCVNAADPAALFFSSGSTGRPKGILHAHRGIAVQLWRWPRILGLDPDVRAWPANGFFWSAPFGMGLGTLSIGGTLVLLGTFDAHAAIALIERERVTCPMGWPHQWAQLAGAANYADADLSSLRYVAPENPIGEHPSVSADWPEPTRIYGNTETFTLSSGYRSGTPEDMLKGAHGFPLAGMAIKVRDPATGRTLPMGERGELAVRGVTLMLGYDGIARDETFDEEGFLPTGDGGYLDPDGRVYWEGRLNDIIKTGGANVSPIEIDAVLQQCEGVKLAKTIGVPDKLLGELVVTCIIPHDGAQTDETTVRAYAKARLAAFKVPRRIVFLHEADVSRTGSDKVRTAELRELVTRRLDRQPV